jgi:hypothetical protein
MRREIDDNRAAVVRGFFRLFAPAMLAAPTVVAPGPGRISLASH